MDSYLKATEYAYTNLFRLYSTQSASLEKYETKLNLETSRLSALGSDFRTSELSEDFNDLQINHKFSQYAESASKTNELTKKIAEISHLIESQKHATRVIAGAILQIAKQAISIHEQKNKISSQDRGIEDIKIRDIIWYGRNQALHYEEKPRGETKAFFKKLEEKFGEEFSVEIHPRVNFASQIIRLLKWNSKADFVHDMGLLCEASISQE